jgi:hypothetical protein
MKLTINEAEYKDFFSKETLSNLKGKTSQSLKSLLKGKNWQQAMGEAGRYLSKIKTLESSFISELETLAEVIVRDMYGIAEDNKVVFELKIKKPDISLGNSDNNDEDDEYTPPMENFPLELKRRIINSISQGGSIRGSYSFFMFKEYLDNIDPELIESYRGLMDNVFGVYDDDTALALFLSMVARGGEQKGGESEGYYDENTEQFIVRAEGIVFPILLHEAIKGLYEIVAIEGFTQDTETNKQIIKQVDKLGNEPEDLRYGKFIYDGIVELVNNISTNNDSRVRDYFISEIYKLRDVEFLSFIENMINNKLSSSQRSWAKTAIREIENDLKKDDSGLSGLDYGGEEEGDTQLI